MGVAAFGNGVLAAFAATGVLAGHESQEGHEFSRMVEAPEVTEFTDEGHCGNLLEAFAGHERLHDGLPFPVGEKFLHLFGKALDALQARVDGLQIFFKDDVLDRIGESEMAQVT